MYGISVSTEAVGVMMYDCESWGAGWVLGALKVMKARRVHVIPYVC